MDTPVVKEQLTDLPDPEIVEKIVNGEKNLFALLMRRYNARLYRIGMAMAGDDGEIEDLMQNAYIKAYQNLGGFEHRSAFGTWLTRIMINECLQHLKKMKRRSSIGPINIFDMNSNEPGSDHRAPDRVTMNRELGRALEQAVLELPEKYRLIFVMREIEDMTVAETVETLGLTESNVKVRLNRAKSMLREKLNSYYKSDMVFPFHLSRCDRVVDQVIAVIG
jgi:RNA polymerase sigma-70 factor (ECF subfamily)